MHRKTWTVNSTKLVALFPNQLHQLFMIEKDGAQVCLSYHMSILEGDIRLLNIEDVLQSSRTMAVQIQLKSWLNVKEKKSLPCVSFATQNPSRVSLATGLKRLKWRIYHKETTPYRRCFESLLDQTIPFCIASSPSRRIDHAEENTETMLLNDWILKKMFCSLLKQWLYKYSWIADWTRSRKSRL